MNESESAPADRKLLILAATAQEADALGAQLTGPNIEIAVCQDASELQTRVQDGSRTLLVTRDVLAAHLDSLGGGSEDASRIAHDLETRTRELAQSLKEFDQFATVVSHDLRSPLLSMTGCVELLTEQLQGKLAADEQELLGFVRTGADRLNQMIKGLLDFSRTGARPLEMTQVALDDVLAVVISDLASDMQYSGGRITHDPLPVVSVDRTQLADLLRHLIENALKFRSSGPPVVHIWSEPSPDGWTISLKDNGLGIAPEHAERIFKVFQRLHGEGSSYKGIGIGLAICAKIVDRHGGRIWVESTPGQGSIFRFTLPR